MPLCAASGRVGIHRLFTACGPLSAGMDDAIATHYALAPQATPRLVGGLSAFAAVDRRDSSRSLLAVQIKPALPPRARMLGARVGAPVAHAVMPLDHGPGRDPSGKDALFIFCPALPGAPMAAAPKAWAESEVLRCVLLPAAAALEEFGERGLTHRAIRPDNMFRAGPGEKITLGPCWAAPPASLQPAAFEPPYAAQCLPAGRGDGTLSDDVYALGVTLLWCVLGGEVPWWEDEAALLRRKLSQGSLAALAGQARLSPTMIDLLRGMLAEDPDHRPAPSLLLDPEQARSRRVATRPSPRAQRALELGDMQAWYPRELALALGANPDQGALILRNGTVSTWLRRTVGDTALAMKLDETLVRATELPGEGPKPNTAIVSRAITTLDPLAPLLWRGHAVFPDGIATALVAAVTEGQTALTAALEDILAQDVTHAWVHGRAPRPELIRMQQDVRDWRDWLAMRGLMGGLPRVLYGANPLLPCLSPLLGPRSVTRLADLLPALEACAPDADRKRPPVDAHIAAFIAARADQSVLAETGRLRSLASAAERLSIMGLFGRLQQRMGTDRFPRLAGWLLESGLADLEQWRSLKTRQRLGERLGEIAGRGVILPMVQVLTDSVANSQDAAEAQEAAQRLAEIEAALSALESGAGRRRDQARDTGHDIATGLSLLSVLGGAVAVLLEG